MDEVIYEFQGLLKRDKKGTVVGPMSPIGVAEIIAKEMKLAIHGLVRVVNNQANNYTFDHLIIKTNAENKGAIYSFFVNIGVGIVPIAMWDRHEIIVTPVYKQQLTLRKSHLDDLEAPKNCKDNPLMKLSETELEHLFKLADVSDEFKIKDENK